MKIPINNLIRNINTKGNVFSLLLKIISGKIAYEKNAVKKGFTGSY